MLHLFAEWRLVAPAALALGMGISPVLAPAASLRLWLAFAAAGGALIAFRPPRPGAAGNAVWLGLVALTAGLAGAGLGAARVHAIDAGALPGAHGDSARVTGFVTAVPRRTDGKVRIEVEAPAGKVLVEVPEPVADLGIGEGVEASGQLARPPPWYEGTLRRRGIGLILRSREVALTGERRGGLRGRLDAVRERAVGALGQAMPEREAALARGFVLGQDDSIDPRTIEDFRDSGLSHLLAVSGQNVLLLALLAAPFLALLGVPLQARLLCLLAVIALYVPLAGGGPSIQRAGVMGAAALVATMAGRPSSRVYALLVAAVITLALNPRATGDPGWQLSFAAVIGIVLLAGPLAELIGRRLGPSPLSAGVAEGAGVTVAATLATAPLIAAQFGTASVASIPANLLALPAVAPSMWIGMSVAALGQVPHFPVEALNGIDALLLGYIAQIAAWFGRPGWASVEVPEFGLVPVLCAYLLLALGSFGVLRRHARQRAAGAPSGPGAGRLSAVGLVDGGEVPGRRPRLSASGIAACLAVLLGLTVAWVLLTDSGPSPPGHGLRVTVLDVGQGDAILLEPPRGEPVLVDTGTVDGAVLEGMREAGVDSLGALVITHDESDHSGGAPAVLGAVEVDRLAYAFASKRLLRAAAGAGASPARVAEGSELRSGGLRLSVLWPPRALLDGPVGDDRNSRSVVILARWRRFRMLLTGDAEAEVVPLDPGPVDVLKVSHHGSDDAGLVSVLERSAPGLAVISVGEDNAYGHPTTSTLQDLAEHDVTVWRTDEAGSIVIDVDQAGYKVHAAGRSPSGRRSTLAAMADSMKPAYLICGSDTAKIDATRARLRARAEAEGGAAALEILDRREGRSAPDVEALLGAIGTLSLAMSRRYILADGVERWRDKALKEVAAVLADLPPDLTVVLIARGKAPGPIAKAVEKAGGEVRNFEAPKAREIPRRLVDEASRLGFRLDPAAARALVERMGTSQVRLGHELERLALWAGEGGEVTGADLDEMVSDSSEAAAYSLSDALLDREPAQVIALSERLLAQGEGVTGLIRMLASRLRKAGEALAKLEDGQPRRQVEGSLGMHPYAAKLLLDRINDASPEEIREATATIADLEVWCRGGAEYGDELALTLALRKAAGAAA